MSLEDLFCDVDDFCRRFLPVWHRQQLQYQERQRLRGCRLALSEIMTILIHFHQSPYRNFKAYYWLYVCRHLAGAFPNRLSYNRLVAVIPAALVPLCVYLQTRKGLVTGIAFIDATSLVDFSHFPSRYFPIQTLAWRRGWEFFQHRVQQTMFKNYLIESYMFVLNDYQDAWQWLKSSSEVASIKAIPVACPV